MELLRRCVEVLRRHHDFTAAHEEIAAFLPVTKNALKERFRVAGLSSPTSYLAEPPPVVLPDWAIPARKKSADSPSMERAPTREPVQVVEPVRVADRSFVARDESPVAVGKPGERWLFIPDTHAPYHDTRAWALALAVARALRPDGVCILGDFIDCYSVSFHEKSPSRVGRLADEIESANECLDELDAESGARIKVFVEGNHENRLARYIAGQAKALHGMAGLNTRDALRLDERGYRFVRYHEHGTIGDTVVTHEAGRAGVYAVRQTMLSMGRSLIIGHVHRVSSQHESTLDGRPLVGHSFGWLGSIEGVDYRHRSLARREWQHAVGVGTIDALGTLHVHAVPFVGGRAVVLGQEVRA